MPQKITTAVCKQALQGAWPAIFGTDLPEQSGKWKRVSKRGKKGEPIERVFYHDTLPLQALVVEESSAITKTIIRGFAPFDAPEESASEQEAVMLARSISNEGFAFLQKYPCFQPSDFLFRVCTEEEALDDGTWYQLFPTRDFGRGDAECDDLQLDYLIASHLPDGDGEVTEATFSSERTVEETKAELIRRGFIPEESFVSTSRAQSSEGDDD
ncbi:MAG TPA: hypothetical protein V6C97_33740 [Oculatellaceae cyanobacterium]